MIVDETHRMIDLGENGKIDINSIQLIDLLPCYITVQDTSLHIIFANKTFKKDFGDKIGNFCHIAYKNVPTQCDNCPVQKSMKDKKMHFSEETVQTNDGLMCQLLVHSAPIFDMDGNVIAVIEMATNITKIKITISHKGSLSYIIPYPKFKIHLLLLLKTLNVFSYCVL